MSTHRPPPSQHTEPYSTHSLVPNANNTAHTRRHSPESQHCPHPITALAPTEPIQSSSTTLHHSSHPQDRALRWRRPMMRLHQSAPELAPGFLEGVKDHVSDCNLLIAAAALPDLVWVHQQVGLHPGLAHLDTPGHRCSTTTPCKSQLVTNGCYAMVCCDKCCAMLCCVIRCNASSTASWREATCRCACRIIDALWDCREQVLWLNSTSRAGEYVAWHVLQSASCPPVLQSIPHATQTSHWALSAALQGATEQCSHELSQSKPSLILPELAPAGHPC